MPLYQLADFFKLQFMFKFTKQLLPSSFDNLWLYNGQTRNEDIHISEKYKRFYVPKIQVFNKQRFRGPKKDEDVPKLSKYLTKRFGRPKNKFLEVKKKHQDVP